MRRILCLLAALLLAAWLAAPGPAAAADKRPNILFVFTDDHATHAISAYGSKINETPNLDRLAQGGMLFRNCFCTNSICAPSRAVILTGKHSHLNGVIDNRLAFDGSQQTFPKLLQGAGYQTAMIGKWHLKSAPTGFDYWHVLPGQGSYYNPAFLTPDGNVKYEGYVTDIVTDLALDYLKNKREAEKPFLLMYQHKAPHREWAPGPKHLTMYDDRTIPEPATLFDDYEGRTSATAVQEMTIAKHMSPRDVKLVPPGNLTPEQLEKWNEAYGPKNEAFREANLQGDELVRWKYQRYIKDYLRCIASVDDNLGRVLDYLDETGLAENTIVVYSSDQGFYLGDHGWYDKRWMYEESLRMPLIVRWPGVTKPGSENKHLVQNLDFAETFLDAAGVKIPADMQGRSLVPLLKGKNPEDWRKSIYYEYFEFPAVHQVHRHYGVRTDRYKLIYYHLLDEWELFDLEKDPDELKSVYGQKEYAKVQEELKAELARLRKETGAEEFEDPNAPPDPKKVKLSQVLGYRADPQAKNSLANTSGKMFSLAAHDGLQVLASGFQFGQQTSPLGLAGGQQPDPSYRPLTLGGWVRPEAATGAMLGQGGESLGYVLYLEEGRPTFAVRSNGSLATAVAEQTIEPSQWTHVAATLDAEGQLQVYVNGQPSGSAVKGSLLTSKPADAFQVGGETGSLVGSYQQPLGFEGQLNDLRLYWGVLPAEEIKKWATPQKYSAQ